VKALTYDQWLTNVREEQGCLMGGREDDVRGKTCLILIDLKGKGC